MAENIGKILTIDLGAKSTSTAILSDELVRKYIGGKGLGAYLLSQNVARGIDPLSEGNVIVLTVGPLTGTKAPASNRYAMFFKSPLTGIWGESYCGGHLALQFKRAGYEALVIKGRASTPTYISIINENVELHDASVMFGMSNRQT